MKRGLFRNNPKANISLRQRSDRRVRLHELEDAHPQDPPDETEIFDIDHLVGFEPDLPVHSFRTIIQITMAILVVIAAIKGGILYALGAMLVLGILYLIIEQYLRTQEQVETLKQYAQRTENIYECSRQPFPADRQVHRRAEDHRRWLRESQNRLDVTVHELYFQDAHNPNETWPEFRLRIREFILEDRKRRHVLMSGKDREKYKQYFLNQDM